MSAALYVGLMSGTSLDGVDAILADFSSGARLLSTYYCAYPQPLRDEILRLLQPGEDELTRAAKLGLTLARCYAEAVERLLLESGLPPRSIRAIGCHGQTVRHRPQCGYSLQLVDGALLAELAGIAVVCDFRSRDIAAGGEGAPLVPAFHAAAFHHPSRHRVVVNLGGIANLTCLPAAGPVTGFDCGPANALLDEWAQCHLGTAFDPEGRWAASGEVLPELLAALGADPYFRRPPPKSTGRDYFNLTWARAHLRAEYRPQDVQATFAALSADALGSAVERYCLKPDEILLCGGGVANADLVARIERRFAGLSVSSTAGQGIHPDWVEALAFAWLAHQALTGRPGNLPEVTGARGPRVLGCIYPA